MIRATFDIGVMKKSMFETRYSNYFVADFSSKDEVRMYAHGMANGLRFKCKSGAVHVRYDDGSYEDIY